MPELEKTKPSRTKRESSKVRETDAKQKSRKPSDSKTLVKPTRSKSHSKGKPEEKEPYTKPSPRTLRQSSSSNAKVDLKAPPPNTTVTKGKASSRGATSRDGEASTRTTRSKADGKAFSVSKSSSKAPSSKPASRDARKPPGAEVSSSSKSRRSTDNKKTLPETKSSKDDSRRRDSRDPGSSRSSKSTPKTSSKEKTKDERSTGGKSRSESSRSAKDVDRNGKPKKVPDKESTSSHSRQQSKSDHPIAPLIQPQPQPPSAEAEKLLEEPNQSTLETGEGELSLDAQESGISELSPRPPLSREDSVEEEVEGSISSKYVEVGDAEEVDEMIAVGEEEPEIAELSEDSGVAGNYGSNGHEESNEFMELNSSLPGPSEVAKASTSEEAPTVDEEEEDMYGDDDFENYDSDFEATDEAGSEPTLDDEDDSLMEDDNEDEDDENDLTEEDEVDIHEKGPIVQSDHGVANDPGTAIVLQKAIMESIRQENQSAEDETKPTRPKTSRSFVNFAKLKEKHGVNQTAQADSRGITLLSMITLDTVSLDLLTLQPINYDAFISSYGLTNTQQASSQTSEDNLSQETQTDEVKMLSKWTQQPISVNVSNLEEPPTPQDYLGVGGEMPEATSNSDTFPSKASGNVGRLAKFLSAASQVVLSLLEEESMYRSSSDYVGGSLGHGKGGGGFSNHGVLLGGDASDETPSFAALLATSAVMCVHFSASDPSIVATGHGFCDQNTASPEAETDYGVSEKSCSGLVIIWSVHEPSQPKYILRCNSTPKTLAFSPGRPLLVMAGLADSTLAVWDLKEPAHMHPNMTIDQDFNLIHVDVMHEGLNTMDSSLMWRCRVPSFITACTDLDIVSQRVADTSEDQTSYTQEGAKKRSKRGKNLSEEDAQEASTVTSDLSPKGSSIICLQTVDVSSDDQQSVDSNAFQVVSLSSGGELVWWVVVQIRDRMSAGAGGDEVSVSAHTGASPWSRITVNQAFSYSVLSPYSSSDTYNRMGCTDFQLSPSDTSTIYVSTDGGAVRHINRLNNRTNPHAFLPEMDPGGSATCICVCPHLPNFLLVGCIDGSVRLHSLTSARPLTTWPSPDLNNPRPVVQITWSHERPCVFYVHEHQRVHVWDLSAGDMSPITSLDTDDLMGEEGPMIFCLAPARLFNRDVVNALFGSRAGRLILRKVESDFLSESPDEKEMELDRFKFYATII